MAADLLINPVDWRINITAVESDADVAAAAREAGGPDLDLIIELHRKLTPMVSIALAEALKDEYEVFFAPEVPTILINGGCLNQLLNAFKQSWSSGHPLSAESCLFLPQAFRMDFTALIPKS